MVRDTLALEIRVYFPLTSLLPSTLAMLSALQL